MVSTFTPNIQLEEPARGDLVGVWDVPVNNNMTLLDLVAGGQTTVPAAGTFIVLSAAQFQCSTITFTSTLQSNFFVVFPSTFNKTYTLRNLCTGSSAFAVIACSTGPAQVGLPPGDTVQIDFRNGVPNYLNLGRVGSYWDYAGSSVPLWCEVCTPNQPYLECNGQTFNPSQYPNTAWMLGGNVLPDTRGRVRAMLDKGAGRISSGVSGINGNLIGAGGGDQSLQAHTHANTLTDPGHAHNTNAQFLNLGNVIANASPGGALVNQGATVSPAMTGVTITNASAGGGLSQNVQPTYIGGITLLRMG